MTPLDRRAFLRRAAGAAGLAAVPASLTGLVAACTGRDAGQRIYASRGDLEDLGKAGLGEGGYGELVPGDGPMQLPADFRLRSFGAIGDPMSDGNLTPIALDGMAAFPAGGGRVRLLRNHEDRNGAIRRTIGESNAYDPAAGGGVVTLEVDAGRRLVRDFVSLNGTAVNCAGGPTPWGSWLSCEETVVGRSEGFEKRHGFVFEVPSSAEGPVTPEPLLAMGRFSHEAVAVDPDSGIVYLTEDHGHPPGSGFYRFLPASPGELRKGGRLQMARVRAEPNLELFRGADAGISVGDTFEVEWVDIDEPNPDPDDRMDGDDRLAAVFTQGHEKGAAVFDRLEGCWFGEGSIFFHDTSGGAAGLGHVWQYLPGPEEGRSGETSEPGRLVLVFESPGTEHLDSPDNITVSPRGGIVICEDGGGSDYLRGLTPEGRIFDLAVNTLNGYELAGATFGPDGDTLFVNIQGPTSGTPEDGAGDGMTVAIWGPWERGAL